jgi:hypothetical protein
VLDPPLSSPGSSRPLLDRPTTPPKRTLQRNRCRKPGVRGRRGAGSVPPRRNRFAGDTGLAGSDSLLRLQEGLVRGGTSGARFRLGGTEPAPLLPLTPGLRQRLRCKVRLGGVVGRSSRGREDYLSLVFEPLLGTS